jgi:hypothetical protein
MTERDDGQPRNDRGTSRVQGANLEGHRSGVLEVLKEQAAVKPVRGLMKWHRGQNLAIERHQKPKEWAWVNCGSQRKVATGCRGMTFHAKVPWHKGDVRKNRTRDNMVRGTLKGWMLGRRQRTLQEGNKEIKDLGSRQPHYI